jgi:hypothetical protein
MILKKAWSLPGAIRFPIPLKYYNSKNLPYSAGFFYRNEPGNISWSCQGRDRERNHFL